MAEKRYHYNVKVDWAIPFAPLAWLSLYVGAGMMLYVALAVVTQPFGGSTLVEVLGASGLAAWMVAAAGPLYVGFALLGKAALPPSWKWTGWVHMGLSWVWCLALWEVVGRVMDGWAVIATVTTILAILVALVHGAIWVSPLIWRAWRENRFGF